MVRGGDCDGSMMGADGEATHFGVKGLLLASGSCLISTRGGEFKAQVEVSAARLKTRTHIKSKIQVEPFGK